MNNKKYVEIIAPFDGFYNTIHGGNIESISESLIDDENPNDDVNYQKTRIEYCKDWVNNLSTLISDNIDNIYFIKKIDIKFKDLDSPKYYNYTNDRLVMSIDNISIQRIENLIIKNYSNELEIELKKRFTPRDGFSPSYPKNIRDFMLTKKDHNTRAVYFKVFLENVLEIETETLKELVEYENIEIIFNEVEK